MIALPFEVRSENPPSRHSTRKKALAKAKRITFSDTVPYAEVWDLRREPTLVRRFGSPP